MEIKIENGLGIIDIISDDFVNCLKIQQPIVVDWYDCHGSVGKYFAAVPRSGEETENLVKNINQIVINGTDEEIFLEMKNFLQLFSSGTYQMDIKRTEIQEYQIINDDRPIGSWNPKTKYENTHSGYYPLDDVFVFSQSLSSINKQRVNYYVELIQNGARPKPIIFCSHFFESGIYPDGSRWISDNDSALFIIDGHHKFLAYQKLKINPELILIEKVIAEKGEFIKNKDKLYFQIESFLDNSSKKHIISHRPQICLGNSKAEMDYNLFFDNYLKETGSLTIEVLQTFLTSFQKDETNHLKWLIHKLEILRTKIISGNKMWLNFKSAEKPGWEGMNCETQKDFDSWCGKVFHNSLEEMKRKLAS
jgi:hypothetical protein